MWVRYSLRRRLELRFPLHRRLAPDQVGGRFARGVQFARRAVRRPESLGTCRGEGPLGVSTCQIASASRATSTQAIFLPRCSPSRSRSPVGARGSERPSARGGARHSLRRESALQAAFRTGCRCRRSGRRRSKPSSPLVRIAPRRDTAHHAVSVRRGSERKRKGSRPESATGRLQDWGWGDALRCTRAPCSC